VKAVTDTFLYSLWFHDIIYDPKRHDNEQQSAEVFGTFAEEL
jgi:predicted metal-dependent HD superfamily phosphohydrolase